MTYQLKTPIKSRVNGEDVLLEELSFPEVVTVGMLRKCDGNNGATFSLEMTIVASGLKGMAAEALTTSDAVGYLQEIEHLLEPEQEPSFEIPEIRPVRAVMKKITATEDQRIEYAAQLLELHGMKKSDINAMDMRGFVPAAEQIYQQVFDPK